MAKCIMKESTSPLQLKTKAFDLAVLSVTGRPRWALEMPAEYSLLITTEWNQKGHLLSRLSGGLWQPAEERWLCVGRCHTHMLSHCGLTSIGWTYVGNAIEAMLRFSGGLSFTVSVKTLFKAMLLNVKTAWYVDVNSWSHAFDCNSNSAKPDI